MQKSKKIWRWKITIKERFSIVTDIFNSIQEIKIYNTSKYFIDNYKKVNSKFADISTNQLNLVIVPKYVFSQLFILFLFFIFAFLAAIYKKQCTTWFNNIWYSCNENYTSNTTNIFCIHKLNLYKSLDKISNS